MGTATHTQKKYNTWSSKTIWWNGHFSNSDFKYFNRMFSGKGLYYFVQWLLRIIALLLSMSIFGRKLHIEFILHHARVPHCLEPQCVCVCVCVCVCKFHSMWKFPGQGLNPHHSSDPKPQQWQCQFLNPLRHKRTPETQYCFCFDILGKGTSLLQTVLIWIRNKII